MKNIISVFVFGLAVFVINPAAGSISPNSDKDVAVQTSKTASDLTGFSARAQALGLSTLSQVIGAQGLASKEWLATFESRLIRAQENWIQFQSMDSPAVSTSSIEKLLELEFQTAWDLEARKAFYEFHRRMARMRPELRTKHLISAAIYLTHFRLSKTFMPTSVPIELAEIESGLAIRWISFAEVPEEISGLFVDGHWYDRSQSRFPLIYEIARGEASEVSLIGISNSHWPVTATVRPRSENLDVISRLKVSEPLVTDPSSCISNASFAARLGRLIAIENESCQSKLLRGDRQDEPNSSHARREMNFGIGQVDPDPFRNQEPIAPLPRIKPWVWATLGGIAITALVLSQNRKHEGDSSTVQPVHRTGW